jgi:hypothetical protein
LYHQYCHWLGYRNHVKRVDPESKRRAVSFHVGVEIVGVERFLFLHELPSAIVQDVPSCHCRWSAAGGAVKTIGILLVSECDVLESGCYEREKELVRCHSRQSVLLPHTGIGRWFD